MSEMKEIVLDARFELAKSRLMDTNLPSISDHLVYEFAKFEEGKETITINEARAVLLSSKKCVLTPF